MMILAKVVDDPQSGTCLNVSYADVSGPVANYNPTGSPYAHQQTGSAFNASTASLNSSLSSVGQSLMLNGGLNLTVNLGSPLQNVNPTLTAQLLDHIKVSLIFYFSFIIIFSVNNLYINKYTYFIYLLFK